MPGFTDSRFPQIPGFPPSRTPDSQTPGYPLDSQVLPGFTDHPIPGCPHSRIPGAPPRSRIP
eukprot:8641310-Lingulodinium_polyedra.AAC.1